MFFDHQSWQSSPPTTLPTNALDWLTCKDSLTKRLRDHTQNNIEFCLLYNDWDADQLCWIREMEWRFEGQTWMHCVVTIPKDSFIDELQQVGHRPIGEILFAEPSLTRSDFLYQERQNHYTRKSTFHFKEKPLDIIETFYPAFFESLSCSNLTCN